MTNHYTVTATKDGKVTDITGQDTITVTLSEDGKMVTATFKDGFVLDKDTTYAVNFDAVSYTHLLHGKRSVACG